ncbi:hypothetical protein BZA70DRAFT_50443 [Myxozyma melibiosi]|uniref:Uncharacterized protein n=1 Tax=Myxozyma melibiosi TaxID=54550 RepID=A0ABR1FFA6_9ASCO
MEVRIQVEVALWSRIWIRRPFLFFALLLVLISSSFLSSASCSSSALSLTHPIYYYFRLLYLHPLIRPSQTLLQLSPTSLRPHLPADRIRQLPAPRAFILDLAITHTTTNTPPCPRQRKILLLLKPPMRPSRSCPRMLLQPLPQTTDPLIRLHQRLQSNQRKRPRLRPLLLHRLPPTYPVRLCLPN